MIEQFGMTGMAPIDCNRCSQQARTLPLLPACPALLLFLLVCGGCHVAPRSTFSADRPSRHSLTTPYFVLRSDVQFEANDPIILELQELREQIASTLQLPPQRDPVVIYLFTDEVTYRYYMQNTWSNLPPRRAYFVGTPRELAVYSFRSPKLVEDLRHEFTHGILHASLSHVPLWLDEGLAEYFEVPGTVPGAPQAEHLRVLQSALHNGWHPSLYQLEQITDFRKLSQRDYAESWAWVHFLLSQSESERRILTNYLAELRSTSSPPRLHPLIEQSIQGSSRRMLSHVAGMAQVQVTADGPGS